MRKAKYVVPVLLALAAILGIAGWWRYRASQPIDVTLHFHPFVGPEPLVLNAARYPNPGGEGRFKVRDFQFFLSNIRLTGGAGAYIEPDSYHLVRFDGAEPALRHRAARRAAARTTSGIEFGIGVDAAANKSLAQRGDLDPNGRMAWTWEVGYKFVLFEGTLERGRRARPARLSRRIRRELHARLDRPCRRSAGRGALLDFRVDILRLFQAPAVDMAALPTVKFDRGDAKRLADNYAHMVSRCGADCRS